MRSTTCSDWLIILLACSSGKMKLVADLVFVLFTIVFLTWYDLTSYSIVLPVSKSDLVFRLWSICYRCVVYVFSIILLFFHYSLFDLVWCNIILYSITCINFCLTLSTVEYFYRCIVYAIFTLYFCERLSYNYFNCTSVHLL